MNIYLYEATGQRCVLNKILSHVFIIRTSNRQEKTLNKTHLQHRRNDIALTAVFPQNTNMW